MVVTRDLVMSDNGVVLSGMVVKSPLDAATLSQQLLDLQQVLTALNGTVNAISAPLGGTTTQPYTFAIGNDIVSGGGGDDKLFADDSLILEPIFRNPNYVRGSFWNYSLIGVDKPARSNLRQGDLSFELNKSFFDYGDEEHNFNQVMPHQYNFIYRTSGSALTQLAEDTMFGGGGNDILFGLRGIDQMSGNDGNDYLFGGEENDGLDGGAGTNIVRTTNPSAADLLVINPTIRTVLLNLLSPTLQRTIVELDQSKNDLSIDGDLQINFPD